jgi:hypothetical protein
MKIHRTIIVLLVFTVMCLTVLSCDIVGEGSKEFPDATLTMQALATLVAEADGGGDAASADDDSSSESSSEEGPTATSTTCVPMVNVTTNTNCRFGPGEPYEYLGALVVGEEAQVLGQSSVPNFMIIDNPDNPGEQCWLWDMYAQVSCDISTLPVMEPPPLVPDWNGTWSCWVEDTGPFTENYFSVNVIQNGDQMTVDVAAHQDDCGYTVTLNEDFTEAYGTCPDPDYPADNYLFWTLADNHNQIQGSVGGNWGPWCCSRNGFPLPEPCENY